jgi:hypothetical protein
LTGLVLANAGLDVALHDKEIFSETTMLSLGLGTVLPQKKALEEFFLGLLEADGNIQVSHVNKKQLTFGITIKLKNTPENYDMLRRIKEEFGMFTLRITNNNCVILSETKRENLLKLVLMIDQYGLILFYARTRYAFFKYCLLQRVSYSEFLLLKANSIAFLPEELKASRNANENTSARNSRQYLRIPGDDLMHYSVEAILQKSHFKNWLCGFIEGEGCFCIRKNGNHSFTIAQKDDVYIINAIKAFFKIPNNVQLKPRNVFLIETYNYVSKKRILDFLKAPEQIGLLGEKKLQKESFELATHGLPRPNSIKK